MDSPLKPEATDRAVATFHSALACPAAERKGFLAEACRGDTVLMAEVSALLAAHDDASAIKTNAAPAGDGANRTARFKAEQSGDHIGSYRLVEQIGEGGFGSVWMAEQEEPVQRRVALKIVKLGMDTKEVVARFEQERQALALMDHPNIARVIDAGATPQGRPFFVMELVSGVKITEYCDERKASVKERIELFVQVCHAVQHAHQKGIIHRDIKPSNILVTMHDSAAVPKVIDFGIAKATQGRLTDLTLFTQFEQMIGTPLYMSPEQAERTALDIDTRSDIYSLGVLLYELLTGCTPIDRDTIRQAGLDEIRRLIREADPLLPSARVKALVEPENTTVALRRGADPTRLSKLLRGDLDWIVMKCLEKDRNRRYDAAASLARDLQRHLSNDPITARPRSTGYRLRKAFLRNRGAFIAGGAFIVLLLVGAIVTTRLYLSERAAYRRLLASETDRRHSVEQRMLVERRVAFERAMNAGFMGDSAGMLKAIEQAKQQITVPQFLMLRGGRALLIGQYDEAVRDLEEADRLRADSPATLGLLAVAHFQNGQWEAYERDLPRLRALTPELEEDFVFKGFAVGYDSPEEGLALVDRAILQRRSPIALAVRAEINVWRTLRTGNPAHALLAIEDIGDVKGFTRDNPAVLGVGVSARLLAATLDRARRAEHIAAAEADAKTMEALVEKSRELPGAVALRALQLQALGHDEQAADLLRRNYNASRQGLLAQRYAVELFRTGHTAEAIQIINPERAAPDGFHHLRMLAESPTTRGRVMAGYAEFRKQHAGTAGELFAPLIPLLLGKKDIAMADARDFRSRIGKSLRSWPVPFPQAADFLAGDISAADLIRAAGKSPLALSEVHNTIGYWLLADGDRAGAKEQFRLAVEAGAFISNAHIDSRVMLTQMARDPAWPSWVPAKP